MSALSSATIRRRRRVASGCCAACGQPRNLYGWHCDDCADKHRRRQRSQDFKDRRRLNKHDYRVAAYIRRQRRIRLRNRLLAFLKKKRGMV